MKRNFKIILHVTINGCQGRKLSETLFYMTSENNVTVKLGQ